MTAPNFNSAKHFSQELTTQIAVAQAFRFIDAHASAERLTNAVMYLTKVCDALGFVAVPKADFATLTGFVEEVRDHKPEVISGRARDPQDDVDDMMPVGEFYAFQTDAEAIVGRKVKKVAA